jgi:hypothetical protein
MLRLVSIGNLNTSEGLRVEGGSEAIGKLNEVQTPCKRPLN